MFENVFKGTAVEFKYRLAVHMVVYALGCFAPWDWLLGYPERRLWSAVGFGAMRLGVADFGWVTEAVTVAAVLCAVVCAVLRVWGVAYIGRSIVQDDAMYPGAASSGVVADGPYRYVRNPLYLGLLFFTLALALIMPVSGAVFAIVAIVIFDLRLIGGEEAFLKAKVGAPYLAYMAAVPRLWPSLRPRVAAGGVKADWGQAFLSDFFFVAVAVGYAALAWHYDSMLLGKFLLVMTGVTIVVRALVPREPVNQA